MEAIECGSTTERPPVIEARWEIEAPTLQSLAGQNDMGVLVRPGPASAMLRDAEEVRRNPVAIEFGQPWCAVTLMLRADCTAEAAAVVRQDVLC